MPTGTPPDGYIPKSVNGVVYWRSDNDSGAGGGVNNSLNNLAGYSTTKDLETGGITVGGSVTNATVVSGKTVVAGVINADNSIGADGIVTGSTIGVNTSSVPHDSVGSALFAIEGTDQNIAAGPHWQITTSADNYPLFQMFNYQHDNISFGWDSYYDAGGWKSGDVGSNFLLSKSSDALTFYSGGGNAQGAGIAWTTSMAISNAGNWTMGDNLTLAAPTVSANTVTGSTVVMDEDELIPSVFVAQGPLDLAGWYDIDTDLWLCDLINERYPYGIIITEIQVDCNTADPATELDANLSYCDMTGDGAFPDAGSTVVIAAVDTTTGNYSSGAITKYVPTNMSIFLDMDADPTDANTFYHIKFKYYIRSSD